MAKKTMLSIIQSELAWAAGFCFLFKMYLSSADAKEQFGSILQLAKQINASIMGITGLLGAKKTIEILWRLKKTKDIDITAEVEDE